MKIYYLDDNGNIKFTDYNGDVANLEAFERELDETYEQWSYDKADLTQEKDYSINDRRLKEKPKEVCRVCGSDDGHIAQYNQPTMKCIEYLRGVIKNLELDLKFN